MWEKRWHSSSFVPMTSSPEAIHSGRVLLVYIYIIFDCMLDKQLMGAVPGESPISSWLYIITGC